MFSVTIAEKNFGKTNLDFYKDLRLPFPYWVVLSTKIE